MKAFDATCAGLELFIFLLDSPEWSRHVSTHSTDLAVWKVCLLFWVFWQKKKKKKWRTRWKVALTHILEHFTSKPGVSAPTQNLHLKGSPCCVSDIIKTESCEHHLLSTNVDSPWEPLKLEMNKPLMSGLRKEMYKMRLGQLNSRKLAKASEVTSKGFWNKLEETFTECLGKSELRHGK